MSPEDEKSLIRRRVPAIDESDLDRVMVYAHEHRAAFYDARVLCPLTPRSVVALCEKLSTYKKLDNISERQAYRAAIELAILDKVSPNDKTVLLKIVQRIFPECDY